MVRFDCEKPVKQVALISDEVASRHCYLERDRQKQTMYVHMRNESVGTGKKDRDGVSARE